MVSDLVAMSGDDLFFCDIQGLEADAGIAEEAGRDPAVDAECLNIGKKSLRQRNGADGKFLLMCPIISQGTQEQVLRKSHL